MGQYPSVTKILKIVHSEDMETLLRVKGARGYDRIMKEAADRGTAFHKITEQIDRGEDIDIILMGVKHHFPHLIKAIKDYAAWFIAEVETCHIIEKRLECDKLKFCGKPDIVVKLKGKERLVCIEKKFTAEIYTSHRYQMAAYCYLAEKELKKPVSDRLILRFQEKGLVEKKSLYGKDKDFNLFICAMNLWRDNQ